MAREAERAHVLCLEARQALLNSGGWGVEAGTEEAAQAHLCKTEWDFMAALGISPLLLCDILNPLLPVLLRLLGHASVPLSSASTYKLRPSLENGEKWCTISISSMPEALLLLPLPLSFWWRGVYYWMVARRPSQRWVRKCHNCVSARPRPSRQRLGSLNTQYPAMVELVDDARFP